MVNDQDLNDRVEIEYLQRTIKWFKTQIEPHDCGWMHTTIDGPKYFNRDTPQEEWIEGYNKWKEKHESNK